MRAKKSLWPQIEETFKQMDTAAKELESFQALQKQERTAASYRINNLWEEVQKQKELEQTLQSRYGDLLVELERMQHLMDEYRVKVQRQEEIAAEQRDLEFAEAAANETAAQSASNPEPIDASDELSSSIPIGLSHDGTAGEQTNVVQEHASTGPAIDMDFNGERENVKLGMDVNLADNIPSAMEGEYTKPVQGNSFDGSDGHVSGSDGNNPGASVGMGDIVSDELIAGENKMANDSVHAVNDDKIATAGFTKDGHGVKNSQNLAKPEGSQEAAGDNVDGHAREVSGGESVINSSIAECNKITPVVVNLVEDEQSIEK